MNLSLPASLLVAHFVGDFVLQNDWMALNKSKNWSALLAHVYVYTFTVLVGFPPAWQTTSSASHLAAWFLLVTFVTHFLTDAITSRITARLWFIEFRPLEYLGLADDVVLFNKLDANYDVFYSTGGTGFGSDGGDRRRAYALSWLNPTRHWFFVCIGLDQLIHYITLAATFHWLVK